MILVLLILCVNSEKLSEELDKKIIAYNGEVISLTDIETKELLFSDYSDIFILFCYPQLQSSKRLLKLWEKVSEKVHENNPSIVFAKIDLTDQIKIFSRLQLIQHPCAIYLTPGYYYNFTGPFDFNTMYELVINQNYLRGTPNENPKPLMPIDLLKRMIIQFFQFEPKIVFYVISILTIVGILIYIVWHSLFKRKMKGKDE